LFEYIAAGVPVVASALPETEALIEAYDVGWCVRPDDPDALASALRHALAADRAELSERLDRAAGELRRDVEKERLLALYARLGSSEGAALPAVSASGR
jgi:glycosyltransferase involved in cell wall biosynthesis